MIEIYTDGAYDPIVRRGGWAAVVVEDGQKHVFSGATEETTGNRMEITAALEGVLHAPQGAEVIIYTDSQYVYGCMTQGWKRRANSDLWEKLDAAVGERKVRWEWIEGDKDNVFHKEAHTVATNLIRQPGEAPQSAEAKKLTHVDAEGRPRMVDITGKPDTQREAVAKGRVKMQAATLDLIKKGGIAKGDVLTAAQLAGIMGAKQTSSLIPLCHPLLIGDIKVQFTVDEKNSSVEITATAISIGKTGVEMEAMTAVAVAGLTIYDMCKAVDRGIQITDVRLVRKSGGKSGTINLEDI
jgi:cyclic pyranopterin phosphate synthase